MLVGINRRTTIGPSSLWFSTDFSFGSSRQRLSLARGSSSSLLRPFMTRRVHYQDRSLYRLLPSLPSPLLPLASINTHTHTQVALLHFTLLSSPSSNDAITTSPPPPSRERETHLYSRSQFPPTLLSSMSSSLPPLSLTRAMPKNFQFAPS